jgi:hypothetical protein
MYKSPNWPSFYKQEILSLQFYFGSILSPRRHIQFYLSIKSIYGNITSQNGFIQV